MNTNDLLTHTMIGKRFEGVDNAGMRAEHFGKHVERARVWSVIPPVNKSNVKTVDDFEEICRRCQSVSVVTLTFVEGGSVDVFPEENFVLR